MGELFSAYEAIWPAENSYRENAFIREQVLDDTIAAARLLSLIGFRSCPETDEVQILQQGIGQLNSHTIGDRFLIDEAKVCSAKAAWLATALKHGKTSETFPRYSIEELQELAASPLQDDLTPLNRLRGGAPEAYFYWLKVDSIPR